MIILSLLLTPVLTFEWGDAAEETVRYLESGEDIEYEPSHKITVDEKEHYVVGIRRIATGELELAVPFEAETGDIAIENQETVIKVYYIAHFFQRTDEIEDYIENAEDFGREKRSIFKDVREQLEIYDAEMDITLEAMNPLIEALEEGETRASDLRVTSGEVESIIRDRVSEIVNVLEVEDKIMETFESHLRLIEISEEVDNKRHELVIEIAERREEVKAEIGESAITLITGDLLPKLESDYTEEEKTVRNNRKEVESFFEDTDRRISNFQNRLGERLDEEETEKMKEEIREQLGNYSKELEKIRGQTEDILRPYLEGEDFYIISEETINIIEEGLEKCEEDINISKCLNVKDNYSRIERNLNEMQEIIDTYEQECEPGETQECTTNGETGIQRCRQDGKWGECEVRETEGTNWLLIGGLSAILILLILYKFKDQLIEQDEKKDEKGSEMDEMWS